MRRLVPRGRGPVLLLVAWSALGACEASAQRPATLRDLSFMSGCWRGTVEGGTVLEEFYTAPAPNLMLGTSRYLLDGRAVQFEFSRITADTSGIVLWPLPGGRPSEHGFRLTETRRGAALFEAPEHDFPRRIRYALAADGALHARIDGGAGDARVQEWRMEPVPCRAPEG